MANCYNSEMFSESLVTKLAAFVRSVGIPVEPSVLDRKTRFPGLDVCCGVVLVDESRLIHPGNILHEAGHIAVHDPARRPDARFTPTKGEEIGTIAWSYAATVHLGLPAELIFYPGSFTGWADSLIENFAEGRYLGVPLLQLHGMAVEPRLAVEGGPEPYPHMIRWVR